MVYDRNHISFNTIFMIGLISLPVMLVLEWLPPAKGSEVKYE